MYELHGKLIWKKDGFPMTKREVTANVLWLLAIPMFVIALASLLIAIFVFGTFDNNQTGQNIPSAICCIITVVCFVSGVSFNMWGGNVGYDFYRRWQDAIAEEYEDSIELEKYLKQQKKKKKKEKKKKKNKPKKPKTFWNLDLG